MISGKLSGWTWAMIGFSIIFIICPITQTLTTVMGLTCCLIRNSEKNMTVPYSELRHKFFTEYRKTNPVTYNMALREFAMYMKGKKYENLAL